jgi:hypothetical protein
MVALRAVVATCLFAGALLAGCSAGNDDAAKGKTADQDFDDLALAATETTGVIRGVVVDEAIRPLTNATVHLSGTGTGQTTTNADGLFGFAGLEPGPYFLRVEKAGFGPAQASADVVVGVSEPDVVKVLMTADPTTAPYVSAYVFDGFIECSFSLVAVGFAACSSASAFNDKFSDNYTLDRLPDWAQSEMVWKSTQTVSSGLDLVYSIPPRGNTTLYENYAEQRGPSPLVVTANRTTMEQYDVLEQGLIFRVFNEPIEGTRPSDPVGGDDCLDRPQLGGCATGAGFTVEQSFKVYTTVFYGFEPDPDWLFTVDGPHPVPA